MALTFRGVPCRLGLTAGLIALSAVPTTAEVIFSFKVDNDSARELVHFAAPTGWQRNDKAGNVVFVSSNGHAECSIFFGYPRMRGESDAYFERLWTALVLTKAPFSIEGPKWARPSFNKEATWIMRAAKGSDNLTRVLYVADSRSVQINAYYACTDVTFDNENRDSVIQALVNISFERVATPVSSVTNAANCPFRGDHLKALQWCESQCVQVPLRDKSGLFAPIDSYSMCRSAARDCAIRKSQC